MAKARVGLYNAKGETLERTHKSCPKCGPGIFLAEHDNRRSCGKCGYSEAKAAGAPSAPKVKAPSASTPPKAKAAKPAA